VGLFPVLVPSLTFWVSTQPWASLCPDHGGVAFYARDTADPSIRGCQSTLGGFSTFKVVDPWTTITLPDCATGCFNEPTSTIVIDQNLVAPKVYTLAADSMTIRGETHQGQFYSEPVDVAYYTFQAGNAVGLDACLQCTPTTNLLIGRPDVHLTVTSTLEYQPSTFTAQPYTIAQLSQLDVSGPNCLYNGTPLGAQYCILSGAAQANLNNGFGPTCYDTNIYEAAVFCLGG
jgi:hypothetical protein